MRTLSPERLHAAERFLWLSARPLERLRFEHLFRGASASRVLAALRLYQNDDGGFGQALEPDFRGPVSQPLCVAFALQVLDELGSLEPTLVSPALAYLRAIEADGGGVANVLTSARDYPRAPWWEPDPAQPGCLLPTATILGVLQKHRLADPWIARAEGMTWRALAELPARVAASTTRLARVQVLYEARAGLVFLEHAADRTRAEQVARALGSALGEAGTFEAGASGAEASDLLDFAPAPDALARGWFDDATLASRLDRLLDEQRDDGGWDVPWPAFTPLAGSEWRAMQTLERLKTLRAYGRLQGA